jgi:hypothetical protein
MALLALGPLDRLAEYLRFAVVDDAATPRYIVRPVER